VQSVVLTQGPSTVRKRMEQGGKVDSLCASDYVKIDRWHLRSGDLLDAVPVWIWEPSNGRPTFGGPQKAPGRFEDFRFLARNTLYGDREPWAAAIVEGVPRAGAALAFELHYDVPADVPCRRNHECPEPGQRPTVTVFFDAGNVEVRAPPQNGRRADVPMDAIGVALVGDRARLVDVHVTLHSESDATGPSATQRTQPAQPLPIPASGAVPITVRREDRRLVVKAAGREIAFDAPAATGGFMGFVVEGRGFVRIGAVQVRPLK
jgi:hypothetical protein